MIFTEKFINELDLILEKDFYLIRNIIQKSIDSCPKSVSMVQALKQIKKFMGN